MALSGTLDTFALPDVLRLLGTTEKLGRLRITGDRGSGSVWVDNGQVVATELTSLNSLEPTDIEVVFGLLRFGAGSFTFEADAVAPNAGMAMAMEPILAAAETMLAEWRSIEEVVPSLDVWVGLAAELDGPDVMIDAARWRCIASIGTGAQVGAVAESLQLSEIESCRVVKELVELGLVELIDEPAGSPFTHAVSEPLVDDNDPAVVESYEPEPVVQGDTSDSIEGDSSAAIHPPPPPAAPAPVAPTDLGDQSTHDQPADQVFAPPSGVETQPGASTVPSLASLPPSDEDSIDPLLSAGDPLQAMSEGSAPSSSSLRDPEAHADGSDDLDLNPAEMARQLANLSPKAAKAVAAAAKASTDAERDAALAAVEAEDDSVNRGLLLKFLGSVD